MSHPMSVLPQEQVFYPESDGEPMGETDVHRDETAACIDMLRWALRSEPHIYVAGDNFLYYEEGNPKAVVSPDVYIVRGVPGHQRRIYQLWKEQGHAPCFVMEMTSRSTWLEDHGNKKAIYAVLGVREYFLFDPEGVSLHPALQGYRLGDDGDYHRLEPDADGVFEAQTLGLELWLDDALRLQARDAATGEIIARPEAVRVEREALARECDAVTRQRDAVTRERDALAARLAELEAKVSKN
ncbi:MAG: Uma2 family endonuclease [Polyangiaceae bacterium]